MHRRGSQKDVQSEEMRVQDYRSVREKGLQAFRNRQREVKDFLCVRIIQVLNQKHHQEELRGGAGKADGTCQGEQPEENLRGIRDTSSDDRSARVQFCPLPCPVVVLTA